MNDDCPTCGQRLPRVTVRIDAGAQIVVASGRYTILTETEFLIFEALYTAPGKTATREMLANGIYSLRPNDEPDLKILDVYICKIRRKIEGMGIEIRTVWGQGWRMIVHEGADNGAQNIDQHREKA